MLFPVTPFNVLEETAVHVRQVYTEFHLARNMLNRALVIPGVPVPAVEVPASREGLPSLCLDQLVTVTDVLAKNVFHHRVQRGIDEALVERQNILHHTAMAFCFLVPVAGIPAHA